MDPNLAISIGTIVFSIIGSYFGIKYKLDSVGGKVDAVHKRLDDFEDDFHVLDKDHAQVKQRQEDMREEFNARFRHENGNITNALVQLKEVLLEERADGKR